jgi:hypothetical protein
MAKSFLGITAHYWNANDQLCCFGIDLIEVKERSKADYIKSLLDEKLKELKVDNNNVIRIVTDLGANMIKAFL